MRKLRRRRRWVDLATGAAIAVAVAGPAIAAAIPLLRARGSELGAAPLLAALLAAAGVGAMVAGMRRLPLSACARAVDRALGPRHAGDRVFAAVSFAQSEAPASSFVAALTAEAWARASAVPPRQVVPSPPRRPLVLALVNVVAILVLSLGPRVPSLASSGPRPAKVFGDQATPEAAGAAGASLPIRLPPSSLESEREDAETAATAARAAADAELARLAHELAVFVDELAGSGTSAAAAVGRAQRLAAEAGVAAEQASAAREAAQAGKTALSATGGGRPARADAAALASALDARPAAADAEPAAQAASQLAAAGAGGRAALARAAAAAAEALARAAGGDSSGDAAAVGDRDSGSGNGETEPPRRRLDDGAAQNNEKSGGPGARHDGPQQRRLRQLRRDLGRSAADCRRDPEACQRSAANTGRSLADLERQGRTAEARARLAQSAQQLLDRLQRSGSGAGAEGGRRMRSFSRAAHGDGAGRAGSARGAGTEGGRPAAIAGDDEATDGEDRGEGDPLTGGSALGVGSDDDSAGEPDRPGAGESEGDGDDTGATGTSAASGRAGSGAAIGGAGVGDAPAGAVLGARTSGAGNMGRDAPTPVAGSAAGPSRSQVIAGAASRGFASKDYRRVFTDYAGVIEESLDSTAVPPGRRYLVRRYFQLIRPRGP